MPSIFSTIHNEVIQNFVKRGYSTFFNSSRLGFGKNKLGFLVPLKIMLDYVPQFNDDFVLNGCLLKISSDN